MTVGAAQFQAVIMRKALKWKWYANYKSELSLLATAVSTDPTTHDKTIEHPPGILGVPNSPYQRDINVTLNWGRAGNVPAATMAAALNAVVAALP
jgi:hypothetical protein